MRMTGALDSHELNYDFERRKGTAMPKSKHSEMAIAVTLPLLDAERKGLM
jgi:hypothetical protein